MRPPDVLQVIEWHRDMPSTVGNAVRARILMISCSGSEKDLFREVQKHASLVVHCKSMLAVICIWTDV